MPLTMNSDTLIYTTIIAFTGHLAGSGWSWHNAAVAALFTLGVLIGFAIIYAANRAFFRQTTRP